MSAPRKKLLVAFALLAGVPVGAAHAHPEHDVALALGEPERARQGELVAYIATVANAGHEPASGVEVSFRLPSGWIVWSATASQGSCKPKEATCTLGPLAGGESATATVTAMAASAGRKTVSAAVSSASPDESAANNAARKTTVVRPTRCRLAIAGGPLEAGVRAVLEARVRLLSAPVPGGRVVARTAGVRGSARTNRRGIARLALTPTKPGSVRLSVPSLSRCATRVRVAERS